MATKSSKSKRVTLCDRHKGEQLTVFSLVYESCMCLKCAMEEHESMSDFIPITEGVARIKADGKHLIEEVSTAADKTKAIKRDQAREMERLHNADKTIRGSIRKIRDKITRHIDVLEQRLIQRVKQLVQKQEQLYIKDQHDVQMIDAELKRMKEKLVKSLKGADDVEIIKVVIQEKENFQRKKAEVKQQEQKVVPKLITFSESPLISDFVDNTNELGDVYFQMNGEKEIVTPMPVRSTSLQPLQPPSGSPVSIAVTDSQNYRRRYPNRHYSNKNKYGMHASKHYKSQSSSRSLPPLDVMDEVGDVRRDLKIETADHDNPCNLTGVAALANGRVVVCDSRHKCLQLLNRYSEILDDLVFHYKPCDIATVSDNSVVVSFYDKDFISLFRITNSRLDHIKDVLISGRGGSYSVAYCKNRFAVCRRGEIRVVSQDTGALIETIQIEAHFPQIALSDGGTRIYLSDFVGGKVTCMNDLGKVRWEYSHEELEPCSLAVDLNQLFVADVKGSILVLSTYGILLREVACFGHLQAICVDPNTGTVLVTQESNRDKVRSRTIKIITM